MNSSLYQDYYTIRSQSIQEAYFDRNAEDPTHYVSIQVAASALARRTFGGKCSEYFFFFFIEISSCNNSFKII